MFTKILQHFRSGKEITPDFAGRADDFIFFADKDATPANDEGRVAKLEVDQKIHPFFTRLGSVINAGETLNGATLPVPVYQNTTDNELYACDANDTAKMKFLGFVISNSTNGNPIAFQGSGVIGGFSSLDEGLPYYVQDAVGTIGTTRGTHEVLVGIAISPTQLLIQKGKRQASGTQVFGSTTTAAITVGFKPSKVTVYAVFDDGGAGIEGSWSQGVWTFFGGNDCVFFELDSSDSNSGTAAAAWRVQFGGNSHEGTITTITETGFTLSNTKGGSIDDVTLLWVAEGEI